MIEFDAQEVGKVEEQLRDAIFLIEDATETTPSEEPVNLLRVGLKLGRAIAAIETVAELVSQKLTEEKKKPLTKEEFDKKIYKSKVDPGLKALFEKSQASPCSSPCQPAPTWEKLTKYYPTPKQKEPILNPNPWEDDN